MPESGEGTTGAGSCLVSVVVPTFNRLPLLLRAVASVRMQTHPRWELIVVDDASTDGTVEALRPLADPRIRVLVNPRRRGAGYSRWLGAEDARGSYIAFLDSDDYWLPAKLERQVAVATASGLSRTVVFGPMTVGRRGDARPPPKLSFQAGYPIVDFIYAGRGFPLQTSSLLVSADLAQEVRFDPLLRVNQDTDYLMRLDRAGAHFLYLHEALHVQDTDPRRDRISTDASLIEPSLNWFRRVSGDWSPQARRGYYLNDAAVRVARSGQRWRALGFFLRGVDLHSEPYYLIRQFLRVAAGGDVPPRIRALRNSLKASLGRI